MNKLNPKVQAAIDEAVHYSFFVTFYDNEAIRREAMFNVAEYINHLTWEKVN